MWRKASLRAQQNLDRAALVHRAVRFGDLVESQGQVKDLAWVYLSVPHQVDQLGQEAAHWGGATVEVDVGVEQLLAIELDPMRDADVAHGPTRAGGTNRLHHRLLGAYALQHRVSTDSVGQLLDAGHAIVTALRHDVGCAKLGGEPLPRLVTAHRDDPLGAHLLGGENAEEPDRAVADDRYRRAGLHIRCIGGEPGGTHDVGERQQAREQSSEGTPGVATRVPSTSGTRSRLACAPPTNSGCWQDD